MTEVFFSTVFMFATTGHIGLMTLCYFIVVYNSGAPVFFSKSVRFHVVYERDLFVKIRLNLE